MPSGTLWRVMAAISSVLWRPGQVHVLCPPQMGQNGVQRGEKAYAQQQPRRCGEPAGNAEVRRLLDGGQQQAPDAGRRHHSGGEAKHGPLELGPGLLHKEKYHRSP